MTRFRKLIRRTVAVAWCLFLASIVFLNVRLYCSSPLARSRDQIPPTLVAQLAANRAALEAGAPSQMQEFFPEGYYFSYVLHGLTWVELALRDESYVPQAIEEARWCLEKLDSPEGRAPFPPELPPDHGMFYSAWKCSLRAGVVVLQQGKDSGQLDELRRECDAIAAAIEQSETPFLASYTYQAWPCDMLPPIHALSAYDRITGEDRYQHSISQWLDDARERLDPETGLLPHTAAIPDGRVVSVARATSQVVILRFLPDIDAVFAKEQYERFRKRFLTTFLGAPSVLEYPSGTSGPADVDSGPLIAGRCLSATVFMMGTAQIYGDQAVADAIAQAGETVGLPWTSHGEKRYVGGILPIGDIMVAYAHVARPWFADREHHPETQYRVSEFWRWKIHAVSLFILLPTLLRYVYRRMVTKKRVE